MDNKYKKIIRFIFVIACFFQFTIFFSQNKGKVILKIIHKNNFISSTPSDNFVLNIYSCINCSFNVEYIRNHTPHNYHDSFKINKKVYEINELLDQDQIDFYNATYNNKQYLFVSSSDNGSSRFYSKYKHYYLFRFNKQMTVISFKKLIASKFSNEKAFLELTK